MASAYQRGRLRALARMELELTHCPVCGYAAEVYDRFVVLDERGGIEHVRIRCITGATYERPLGPWVPGWKPLPR